MKLNLMRNCMLLIALSIVEDLHPIENVSLIHQKVRYNQELDNKYLNDSGKDSETIHEIIEELMDELLSNDSIDEMGHHLNISVKNFDYYVPTTKTETQLTTELAKEDVSIIKRIPGSGGEEGGGGGSVVFVVIIVFVIIGVIGGVIGVFVSMKKSSKDNIKKKKGVPRIGSRASLASIETVASDTGTPIHKKTGPKVVKSAPKKK